MVVVLRGQLGFRVTFLHFWPILPSSKHVIHTMARYTTLVAMKGNLTTPHMPRTHIHVC